MYINTYGYSYPWVLNQKKYRGYLCKRNTVGICFLPKSFYKGFTNINSMINKALFGFGKRQIRAMNYTRHISLPKDWLRYWGIDVGDEVKIELTESGYLLIAPVKEGDPQ